MIYIIIPVHNRKQFTLECLRALQDQTFKDFSVVVVDDGSIDGTSEMIKAEFPDVTLIHGDGSLFWTAATNQGIKYALSKNASGIMTLNDDTIPTKDYMKKMVLWNEKKPLALLGAFALDHKSGKPVYAGYRYAWRNAKPLLQLLTEEAYHGIHQVSFYPGRGLLVPSIVFDDIGFYDEKNFPQTVADIDFTMRASRRGFKIYCNFDAKIHIRVEESTGTKYRQEFSFRNYYKHLFDMMGDGNLTYFTKLVYKNCPPHLIPIELTKGILLRLLGYPYQWIRSLKH